MAFPLAEVVDYDTLVDAMACDPKDRHVLAPGIRGGAQSLVTFNLGDFPHESVAPDGVGVLSPDAFLLDQFDLYPARVGRALVGQMTEAIRPPLLMETCSAGSPARGCRLSPRRRAIPYSPDRPSQGRLPSVGPEPPDPRRVAEQRHVARAESGTT